MGAQVIIYGPDESALAAFEEIKPEGVEIAWVNSDDSIEDQAAQMQDAVALIVAGRGRPTVELAAKCSNLRLIQTTSAGTDYLDKVGLGELGISVSNNGGGNAVAVAEHTMGLIVSTIRKLQLQFNAVSAGEWAADIRTKWFSQAHEIAGKTVGIVGLGRIGSRVARRLQGWECEVVYSDIIDISEELEQELNVTRLPLDEVLQTADVITLHVPLGTQTRHMISDREFDMMKPTVIFINACRGPVVDEAALIRALNDGKVAAAGLDVLEQEPTPVDNPLLKMDNVLVTPHLAAFSQEAGEKSRMFAITNSARVSGGDEPDSVVPSTDF